MLDFRFGLLRHITWEHFGLYAKKKPKVPVGFKNKRINLQLSSLYLMAIWNRDFFFLFHTAWVWILFLQLCKIKQIMYLFWVQSQSLLYGAFSVCTNPNGVTWYRLDLEWEKWADGQALSFLRTLQRACLGWLTAGHTMELWSRKGSSLYKMTRKWSICATAGTSVMSSGLRWFVFAQLLG